MTWSQIWSHIWSFKGELSKEDFRRNQRNVRRPPELRSPSSLDGRLGLNCWLNRTQHQSLPQRAPHLLIAVLDISSARDFVSPVATPDTVLGPAAQECCPPLCHTQSTPICCSIIGHIRLYSAFLDRRNFPDSDHRVVAALCNRPTTLAGRNSGGEAFEAKRSRRTDGTPTSHYPSLLCTEGTNRLSVIEIARLVPRTISLDGLTHFW
jgi:hypothetical protein